MSEHAHTHEHHHDHSHHNAHSEGTHAVPLKLLVVVWLTLMLLTWFTVFVAGIDLGSLNLFIAMAVATVKASMVCLYFMHLRWDNPFNAFVFIFSLVCVSLFIFFAMLDTYEYKPDLIPDYAPLINQ